MGKTLSLGGQLKYPITIKALNKRPGDAIKKQESILNYTFSWLKTVGDPTSEWNQWEEEQTTIADWDSPIEGTIKQWKLREGMVITKDMPFVEIEEACPHSVQFQGLCGMCGKDMTEMSWASAGDDTERAKINMIHDQTALRVSQEEASKAEQETQRRLLQHRKLSLVVDLDQTIIHACIEPTVGEWQSDPTSPNYEAVKNVRSFQLNDDGPRGVASGCNYYIKMRPGLKEFLASIAELYELHVYTMGTRAYALNIAKIVDPDKKLFGDRIISRDENGNMTAKSLARLFPENTKMVVIIDDRADVWPSNRLNLIKVVPYDFFVGIGDINSSFLPKREELPKPDAPKKPSKPELDKTTETPTEDAPPAPKPADEEKKDESKPSQEGKVSALEELVRMGGGDDQQLLQEQTAEQEKFLEKQIKDRPLLHMQEELEKEESEEVEAEAKDENEKNGEATQEPHPHHRHKILNDDDTELTHLEQHLTAVHKAFYDEYDGKLVNAHGGRIAQLKPGYNKKVSIKGDKADLQIVPDVAIVMPRLKKQTLAGCVIVMSGLVPLGVDLLRYFNSFITHISHDEAIKESGIMLDPDVVEIFRSEIALQAESFGAKVEIKVSRKITHLVASTNRTRTTKVRQAARYPNIKIVNQLWLVNSMSKWAKEDETDYLSQVHISEADRKPRDGDISSGAEGAHGSDDSSDEDDIPAGSQSLSSSEDEDEEGVIPSDIEGHSPIDDLKGFNWDEVDDELAEFMGSDSESENDSDRDSTRGTKRARSEKSDDGEDSDESTSRLVKKQNTAKSRMTGLKSVKTPQSVGSLPTPGVTGDEEDVVEDDSSIGDDLEKEMEAEMEAELAREEEEAKSGSG
ncbi:RNA polymerase II subunit A C-terminal domain phosphatase [Lachnellula arida]|uniref:RNA polymerase II subunit A C-terminal domain phosphatase n=1 Tax=Lachnellula arida TaxID=1316785 RepID=A0A8T9BA46_9HELO|nr:RNA polymerase II subunit A C-terminal domain phosphatase [Lachnellula arida]